MHLLHEETIPVENRARIRQNLIDALRDWCPNGDPHFVEVLLEQAELHSLKNKAYAGSGNPLGNFNRVAEILKLYPRFPYDTPEGVAMIYSLKQLDCELWSMSQGTEDAIEGFTGRTNDQSVYANLRRCMRERGKAVEVKANNPQRIQEAIKAYEEFYEKTV